MAVSEEGSKRIAEAALWTNGGCEVVLRLPGMAVNGSDAEQLGLATPVFQDVPVGPAAWRKLGRDATLLLGAAAIAALAGSQGFLSAESLFETAVGVVVDGVMYTIAGCDSLMVAGSPCAYRVTVKAPTWV